MKVNHQQKAVALAAILNAAKSHRHVALRPKQMPGSAMARSPGIKIPTQPMHAAQFESAALRAEATWPGEDEWEIFGSDDISYSEANESWDGPAGDGVFMQPRIYGGFFSDINNSAGPEGGAP